MIHLQFAHSNPEDLRTCTVLEVQPGGDKLEIMQTFSTGQTATTEFTRFNRLTHRYEVAGGVQWRGERNGVVTFGAVHVPLSELRRLKKATSRSRRFRWNNVEYKWKRDAGGILRCYDWAKRIIASYDESTLELAIADRGYSILDQARHSPRYWDGECLASLRLSNTTGERESDSEGEALAESNLGRLPTSSTNHNHTLSSPLSSSTTSSSSPSGCTQTSPTQHFPSNSPSIIISHHNHNHSSSSTTSTATTAAAGTVTDPESTVRSIAQRHSTRSIRFTPYLGASKSVHAHARRSSLPDDLLEFAKPDLPHRPSTVSPRLLSSELHLENIDLNTQHVSRSSSRPPAPPTAPPAPTASSKAIHIDIENHPDVPISSFVRRKTPQSSPTVTNFRQKRRAASFSPVLLPTLLPGLPAAAVSQPDVANICEAVAAKLSATERPRVVRQQGLRLSSYRSFYIPRTKIGAS